MQCNTQREKDLLETVKAVGDVVELGEDGLEDGHQCLDPLWIVGRAAAW